MGEKQHFYKQILIQLLMKSFQSLFFALPELGTDLMLATLRPMAPGLVLWYMAGTLYIAVLYIHDLSVKM